MSIAIVVCGHGGCESMTFQVIAADGAEIVRCAECHVTRSQMRSWEVAVQHGADWDDILGHGDFARPAWYS